jgi:hypothetical protein
VRFLEPDNIQAVSIAGYDSAGERCSLKWRWQVQEGRRPPRGLQTYALVPGKQSGHFLPEGPSEAAATREIRILLEIAPNSRAGFVIHKVEIAACPGRPPSDPSEFHVA